MTEIVNIIVVSDFGYHAGGAETVAIDTALELSKDKRYKVYFFCGVGPICRELESSNVEVTLLDVEEYFKRRHGRLKSSMAGLYDMRVYEAFLNRYRHLHPERTVVHFHSWFHALSPSVIHAAYRCNFQVMVTLHEYSSICGNMALYNYRKGEVCRCRPCGLKCMISNCDKRNYIHKIYRMVRLFAYRAIVKKVRPRFVYISDKSRKLLSSSKAFRSLGLSCSYLSDPVNVAPLERMDKHSTSDCYLFVGRVSEEKGITAFCTAVSNAGVRGIVVGEGELLEPLRTQYPSISFVGRKTPNEVYGYMQAARILVFPSVWYETFGLVVVEAMITSALPCLVADDTAAADFIVDGLNGLLFKSGSTSSLIDQIARADSDDLIDGLAQGIDQEALCDRFSYKSYIARLGEIYESLL